MTALNCMTIGGNTVGRWCRAGMLGGLLLAAPVVGWGQAAGAAAYQRDVARVQAKLVKGEIGYEGRFLRAKSMAKAEANWRELRGVGESAVQKLQSLPEFSAHVPLRALALRVAEAQTRLFTLDYKRVIDLNVYQENSLQARQAYYSAFDAALGRVVMLNDSLRAARRDFADEFNLQLDEPEMRVLDQWLAAQHRVANLLHYQHQVMVPVLRVQTRLQGLLQGVGGADVSAFEAARRQLTADVITSRSELDVLPDFANLDILYRNAARDLVNAYGDLCTNELSQVSDLLRADFVGNAEQLAAVNKSLADFTAKVNAANEAYQQASKDFFKTYHPVLDQDNRHTGY